MPYTLKPPFPFRTSFATLVVANLGLGWLAAAPAPEAPVPPPPGYAQSALTQAGTRYFSLEIRDGLIVNAKPGTATPATIGTVIDYVKKLSGTMDVVLAPHVADVPVGDLTMHWDEGNFERLAQALQVATNDKVVWNAHNGWWEVAFHAPPLREVQVFNLNNYLRPSGDEDDKAVQAKLESTLKIINETLKTLHNDSLPGEEATFQFHPGAGLLVATGSPEALDVARKVILALNPSNPLESTIANVVGRWVGALPINQDTPMLNAALAWAASPANPSSYTVQPGDTLATIARKYGLDLEMLVEENPNINARPLRPGQRIHIPARVSPGSAPGGNGNPGANNPFNSDFPAAPPPVPGGRQTGGGSSSGGGGFTPARP